MSKTPPKPNEQPEPAPPKVIPFPHDMTEEEQQNHRVMAEAKRLAGLTPGEWKVWAPKRAPQLGIEVKLLTELVEAQLKDNAEKERKAQAAARLSEDRAKRLRLSERDRQRDDDAKSRAEMAADRKAETEAAKEAARQQKEAERKAKEKQKSFNNLLKLPVERHDNELTKLAKRLGEDTEALQQEFKDFVGVADGFSATTSDDDVEPWPEAVNIADLLVSIDRKRSKYVAMSIHLRTAVTLWTTMSWVHNEIAVHSPILAVTSADIRSGKTTLLGTLARLVQKPCMVVEVTGPSVFRYVDAHAPTMIIDEADDLFTRKSDLRHVVNASWTRGTKIPRQVNINGVSVTVHFDPFCPKAIGLLGKNLPRALKSRCIEIRMVPRRPDETVEPFGYTDDFEFATLRRQLARFAADNAKILKAARPTVPASMNDRAAMNWVLLLAIAELAGGPWPELAREAAQRLTRSGRQPSDGERLLAALQEMFAGKVEITSADVVVGLNSDPLDIWGTYNRGGPVTARQIAILLDAYDVHPVPLHPTKRKDFSRQGYKISQFTDAFARYLPEHPIIQSPVRPKPKKRG
jgi:Protein of unknown function (DUF3631)